MNRDCNESLVLLVGKVIDDVLLSGNTDTIREFITTLCKRFDVGKVVIDERFSSYGSEVRQDIIGSTTMSMHRYIERIQVIDLSRA